MKKAYLILLAMVAVAFSGMAWAIEAPTLMVVNGYQDGGSGAPFISFGPVKDGTYTVTLRSTVAVFEEETVGAEKMKDAAKKDEDVWVATYVKNPSIFEGAIIYAIPCGTNFSGNGKLENIDVKSALSSAKIIGGTANLVFEYTGTKWEPITWMIIFPNEKRAWGGIPGWPNGEYVAHTSKNAPLTVWGVTEDKIIPPGKEVFAFFKKQL